MHTSLISETTSTVRLYSVEHDGQTYHYTEWLAGRKVIDSEIRHAESGEYVEDEAVVKAIEEHIDSLES